MNSIGFHSKGCRIVKGSKEVYNYKDKEGDVGWYENFGIGYSSPNLFFFKNGILLNPKLTEDKKQELKLQMAAGIY